MFLLLSSSFPLNFWVANTIMVSVNKNVVLLLSNMYPVTTLFCLIALANNTVLVETVGIISCSELGSKAPSDFVNKIRSTKLSEAYIFIMLWKHQSMFTLSVCKTNGYWMIGLNCVPPQFICWSPNTSTSECDSVWRKGLQDVIKVKPLGWALIQSAWCPYSSNDAGTSEGHRRTCACWEGHSEPRGGDHVQSRGGAPEETPLQHHELELPTFVTGRRWISAVAALRSRVLALTPPAGWHRHCILSGPSSASRWSHGLSPQLY